LLLVGSTPAQTVLTPPQLAIVDSLLVLNATDGPDAVAALVAEHLPAARARGDSTFVLRLVGARGASYTQHQQSAVALDDLREAAALGTILGDSLSVGRTLLWLSRAYEVSGRHADATATSARLTLLGRGSGNAYYEARGLVGEAWATFIHGDFAVAESLYATSSALAIAANDSFTVLWARNGQGLCYWNLGQLARADTAFATVRREGRRRDLQMVEAAAVNNHAGLLEVLGRPGEALEGYRQSREMSLAIGARREAFPSGLNVARCQQQLGHFDDAAATTEDLIAECREFGYPDLLPGAMDHLARIRSEQGRHALAVRTCREALALGDELRPRFEVQLRLSLASALANLDSLDAALAQVERAATIHTADQDLNMRTEVARTKGAIRAERGEYIAAAEVFTAAAAEVEAAGIVNEQLSLESRAGEAWLLVGRPNDARFWLERSLHLWENTRTLPEEAVWRERRSGDARRLFESLAELTLSHPDTLPESVRLARCFNLLQHYKARTLLERTLGPGRELADPRPVTLAELQTETLRPDEVFLDVHLGQRYGLVFGVTVDTLLIQPLRGQDSVAFAVDVLRGQLDDPSVIVPRSMLRHLAAGVATELASLPASGDLAALVAGAHAISWSPDGTTHQVPLAILIDDTRLTVVRTPSATFLANLRRRDTAPVREPARVLAIAGLADSQGRPLVGAAREVEWIASEFEGVTAVRDTAAETSFDSLEPECFDLLHLAAHAELDAQRPWNSALVLGSPERPQRLRAGDVADLDLTARLAVLTSCNSAAGTVLTGEGMLGLATGFLSAGVPAVVATLWPVDDRQAEVFSRRFYGELERGRTTAEALHNTQAWLRGRKTTAHPFHWAGYVLLGEGTQTVPLTARPGYAWWIAVIAGLITVPATLLARRRRQRNRVKA